jgi:hypothetical protein
MLCSAFVRFRLRGRGDVPAVYHVVAAPSAEHDISEKRTCSRFPSRKGPAVCATVNRQPSDLFRQKCVVRVRSTLHVPTILGFPCPVSLANGHGVGRPLSVTRSSAARTEHRVLGRLGVDRWTGLCCNEPYTRSTLTPCARDARASRSRGSDVNTVAPGSAHATTMASTADPLRARVRRNAARRATGGSSSPTRSHVLRKRFAAASRPAWP